MADYGNGMEEPADSIEARWVRRDPEGRIVAAWTEGVPERFRFVYDHNGERVATFREESLHLLDETYTLRDEGGNVLADLQWTNGEGWSRLADRIYLGRDEQVRVDYAGGGNWTFTTTGRDHLGTARAEVYGNNMWRRLDLWPYGGIRETIPHNTTRTLTNGVYLFTGHERDFVGTTTNPRKGLDYMHARYYTFNLGRFMSVDPVGGKVGLSQSWNRYAYVRGNPINAVDPDGRSVVDGSWAVNAVLVWLKVTSFVNGYMGRIQEELPGGRGYRGLSRTAAPEFEAGYRVGDWAAFHPLAFLMEARVSITFGKIDGVGGLALINGDDPYLFGGFGKSFGSKGFSFRGSFSLGLVANYKGVGSFGGPFVSSSFSAGPLGGTISGNPADTSQPWAATVDFSTGADVSSSEVATEYFSLRQPAFMDDGTAASTIVRCNGAYHFANQCQ